MINSAKSGMPMDESRITLRFMRATTTPSTFVLVHGAWSGGWCYARVAALLRSRGHTVFAPTLTGQGERAHLLSGAINLSTHVEDGLGGFRFGPIGPPGLAGRSYGREGGTSGWSPP